MLKQILKVLIVPVALLLMVGTVRAQDPQGVLDPMQATDILGFNLIEQQGVDYDVSWSGCGLAQLLNHSAFANSTACIYFVNLTGAPITTLDFTFDDNGSIPAPFSCLSADSFLSGCAVSGPGAITGNGDVTMDFSGGTPIPFTSPIPTIFIFGLGYLPGECTDSSNCTPITPGNATMDFSAAAGANVPTHDPSTLVLLATGMAFLAMGAFRRTA